MQTCSVWSNKEVPIAKLMVTSKATRTKGTYHKQPNELLSQII